MARGAWRRSRVKGKAVTAWSLVASSTRWVHLSCSRGLCVSPRREGAAPLGSAWVWGDIYRVMCAVEYENDSQTRGAGAVKPYFGESTPPCHPVCELRGTPLSVARCAPSWLRLCAVARPRLHTLAMLPLMLSVVSQRALGLKPASDLCLEAWTTRVASGPGAVGVPRPPRAGRGRG